mmetsp:Transcript_26257/g.47623  ORF Transcript_26257/g.47623 Transcript_26257/m.47623 type:complete len:98 (+) Transcript_26257:2-295(+)
MMAKLVSLGWHLWVVFPAVFVVVFVALVFFVDNVEKYSPLWDFCGWYQDLLFGCFWRAVLVAFVALVVAAKVSLWLPVLVCVAVFAVEIVAVLLAMQ